jgi:signal transduction histidine kinase
MTQPLVTSTGLRRILVVEDEAIVARDLEMSLMRLEYEVVGTETRGEWAIVQAERTRPDLVLMDIRLRGAVDGIEAAAEIWRRLEIPTVFLTAYADEETVQRARGSGSFGYLVKPFAPRALKAAIEIALERGAEGRSAQARERELVAGVARVIGNPLHVIARQLDLLDVASPSDTADELIVERLREQVDRIRALLAYLRQLTTGEHLPHEIAPVAGVVARAIEVHRELAAVRGILLAVDDLAPEAVAAMEAASLEVALGHLVANAIHFSPSGGTVRVTLQPGGGARPTILCHVDDDGPGIARDDLARVFEPFFSRRRHGVGLGLAIAKRVVDQHGGTLIAQNRRDGGTRFTATLPL